jgi:tetratricopeptide (TPR) repeat protein
LPFLSSPVSSVLVQMSLAALAHGKPERSLSSILPAVAENRRVRTVARPTLLPIAVAFGVELAALLLVPTSVIAQPAPTSAPRSTLDVANKHMDRGQELYMQGKFDRAAVAFAEAYKTQPCAAFLYNEAACHQKLGNNQVALSPFQRYFAADPSAPYPDKVRQRITGERDAIAAGAPGLGSFFVLYCSTLGGAGANSFRCQ